MFVVFQFPRLRGTLVIAFLSQLRCLRDHFLPFFHYPTVEIWKMSLFNVGVYVCLEEANRNETLLL